MKSLIKRFIKFCNGVIIIFKGGAEEKIRGDNTQYLWTDYPDEYDSEYDLDFISHKNDGMDKL